MPVTECNSDAEYYAAVRAAGTKPIVVDFTASWCGPCKMIAPFFEQMSNEYGSAMAFLKVDVDKCEGTAGMNGVSAMPTFLIFVNGEKKETLKGANKDGLEEIIKKWANLSSSKSEIPGQMDLNSLIELKEVECLNGCDDTPVREFLEVGSSHLRSDCDEQIIITVPFRQPVKLHSIQIKGGGSKAPKVVRVFANLPKTLDFDDAQGIEPIQKLEFGNVAGSEDGEIKALKFVKFQNVRNVQLFFENNQEDGEVTEIGDLKFYGTPVEAVNMDNFKRVAGKAGDRDH